MLVIDKPCIYQKELYFTSLIVTSMKCKLFYVAINVVTMI